MKFRIPNNLKRTNFFCENGNTINSNANAVYCSACKNDYKNCWSKNIKEAMIFSCKANNADKYEKIGKCPNCNKYGVEVMVYDNYECTCRCCGKETIITEETMKKELGKQYEEIDMIELDKAIKVALQYI